jgi:tetratricopeptide (TPR) repeat protein
MRLRSLALHAALAAFLLVIYSGRSGGVAAQSSQGRISGVVNDENNKAIKAATVTAENSDTNQTFAATTDDKGRFTIIGLRPGTWRFTAQAPGYFGDQGSMPIRVGSPNPPIAFALKKTGAPGGGALGAITAKDLQSELAAADALFNQRRWDEAVTAYRAIMEKAPSLSVIDLQIAAAYVNKKDYDAAIVAYAELLKVDPNNDKATVGIARADVEKGDPAAAEGALAKAAENPSAGREIFYNLGEILFDTGDTDGSMKWYQKAAETDPSWGKPLYKLGLAAQKKGDKGGAAQFLNKVLAVDPGSPEAAMAKSTLDQLNR